MLLQPTYFACVITMSLLLTVLVGLGCYVGRPLDISFMLWLPWVCPASHSQGPLVELVLIVGIASYMVWLSHISLLV